MMRWGIVTVGAVVMASLVACGGGSEASGTAPSTTQRVYLATALACSKLDSYDARFTPLKVEGQDYTTTVKPKQDCQEQRIFNSYVYEVPMPSSGEVTVTPGNQPPVKIDASKVTKSGAVTVFYAGADGDQFKVTVITYKKDAEVSNAL